MLRITFVAHPNIRTSNASYALTAIRQPINYAPSFCFFSLLFPDKHVIAVRDLGVGGKGQLHLLHQKDRAKVYFCILSQARIMQTKLGKSKKKALELSPHSQEGKECNKV